MKTETKALLESFCKEIKSLLLCSNAEKEELLSGLRMDMEEYLADHPTATMDDLQTHFGTPEDIANSYLFSLGETEVRKRIKKKETFMVLAGLGHSYHRYCRFNSCSCFYHESNPGVASILCYG